MLISVTSEVAWIKIHVARITRPSIRHKKEYNLNLTLYPSSPTPYPLRPTPYPLPLSLTPGIVMARYFDRECERRLLFTFHRGVPFSSYHSKMTADSSILSCNADGPKSE